MPKTVITVLFLLVLFFTGCINKHQKHGSEEIKSMEKVVNPVLLQEIDIFMDNRQTNDSLKIILVDISDSLLYIWPSVYYDDHESAGYSFYKGKLIGFYLNDLAGNWGFIDTVKLTKGVAKGYPDKFPESDPVFDSLEYKYDYRVRTYHIHSKDSLELIFWGYY